MTREWLTPEQQTGARFLAARPVAMLADRAGFGKSAQFIHAAELIGATKIIVICPPAVTENERAEFEKWSIVGWPVFVMRSGADELPPTGVVVVSFALAGTDKAKAKLRKWGADVLILDEAHHVKNPKGVRSRALFNADGIARKCGRVWFVTGTPTPNNASEYYVFARVAGLFKGTFKAWRDDVCSIEYTPVLDRSGKPMKNPYGPGPLTKERITGTKPEKLPFLRDLLSPHILAREKAPEGLPPLIIDSVPVVGAPPDYSGIDPDVLAEIAAAVEAGSWSSLDGAMISTVRKITGIAKAEGVAEFAANELESGYRKTLLFADHRDVIDVLAARLEPFGVGVIDGRTSDKSRAAILSEFEPGGTDGRLRVCICQRQALKEGRTLTRANRVLIAEPPWTPDDNTQMIARAWRRGQTDRVRASLMYLPGSIDEKITRVTARKTRDTSQLRFSNTNFATS